MQGDLSISVQYNKAELEHLPMTMIRTMNNNNMDNVMVTPSDNNQSQLTHQGEGCFSEAFL